MKLTKEEHLKLMEWLTSIICVTNAIWMDNT